MTNRLLLTFIITVALLILWLVSVWLVRWDLRQRKLGSPWGTVWLGVVAFLPAVGFTIYLAARMLDLFLAPPKTGPARTWQTLHKRPEGGPASGSTIAAADLTPGGAGAGERFALFHVDALEGPERGKSFAVASLPAVIGRGQEAVIALDGDLGVSRKHAEIYAQGQALHVRDLGSTHGVIINGVKYLDQIVRPGDRIGIGQSVLQIRVERRGN